MVECSQKRVSSKGVVQNGLLLGAVCRELWEFECFPKGVVKIVVFLGILSHQGLNFWGVILVDKTTSLRLMHRQNRWQP